MDTRLGLVLLQLVYSFDLEMLQFGLVIYYICQQFMCSVTWGYIMFPVSNPRNFARLCLRPPPRENTNTKRRPHAPESR